jgi:hypothetical protein
MRILLLVSVFVALLFQSATKVANAGNDKSATQDVGDGGKADDSVRRILLAGPKPAKDIFEIRQRLEAHGGRLKAHLVVNGGHDNPARTDRHRVKFMCFATYANALPNKIVEEDELFLGFFLGVDKGTVVVLPGFVELIAWDRTKQTYNFWELISTDWHYRGAAHRQAANAYLAVCVQAAKSQETVIDWLKLASQRRREIEKAETARHPDGMITEPGFRIIFPAFKQQPKAGELRLDPRTGKAIREAP